MTPLEFDRQTVTEYLASQPDVVVAYLFGSVAREQERPDSDVDVAVLLEPPAGEKPYPDRPTLPLVQRQLALMNALADFGRREIQVTLLNSAPPFLAYEVVKEGILLYQRSRAERVDFQVRALKIYFDLRPMYEYQFEALKRRIMEKGLGYRERRDSRTLEAVERIRQRVAQSTES